MLLRQYAVSVTTCKVVKVVSRTWFVWFASFGGGGIRHFGTRCFLMLYSVWGVERYFYLGIDEVIYINRT